MKRTGRLLLLLLAFLLCGCGRQKKEPNPSAGTYQIFYLDKSASTLTPLLYQTDTTDANALVAELMQQFMQVPNDADVLPAAGDDVRYESCSMDGTVLYLYFDTGYAELKTERMTLCNAALTETLAQVPGVGHVGIYSGGQPLTSADGLPLGPFAANDFVNSVSDVNSYESAELKLWFADSTGTKLTEETRAVTYRMDTPLEQVVVEQLIAGPARTGSRSVLPADTRLLSVSVNENICYLNFSREFLTGITDEDPYLTIYALTNSLADLKTVQRVQIAVEGERDFRYRDVIPLDTLFEADPEYPAE